MTLGRRLSINHPATCILLFIRKVKAHLNFFIFINYKIRCKYSSSFQKEKGLKRTVNNQTQSIQIHSLCTINADFIFIIIAELMVQVEDIMNNSEAILRIVGSQSFVDWEVFMKQNTQINALFDDLSRRVTQMREVQQRKFINTMKKLKAIDIPDLIKTVKAKKLPKIALKSILSQFSLQNGIIELVKSPESLKIESQSAKAEYNVIHKYFADLSREADTIISEKIIKFQESELQAQQKARFSTEKIAMLQKQIKIEYFPSSECLTFVSYSQIVNSTKQLVKDQFKKNLLESREKQRALMNDPQRYLKAIKEQIISVDELISAGQKAIFSSYGFSPEKLQDLEVQLILRGFGQMLLNLQYNLRINVKQSIVSNKMFSLAHAQEVLKYQIHIMETKGKYFKDVFRKLEITARNINISSFIMAAILNDLVFEKFQLEEEDMMKHITEEVMNTNMAVNKLVNKIQMAMGNRMMDLNFLANAMDQLVELQKEYKETYDRNPQAYNSMMAIINNTEVLEIFHEKLALMHRKKK